MNKYSLLSLILVFANLFCYSCSEKQMDSFIKINKTKIDFGNMAESFAIPISTNIEGLQVMTKDNWCHAAIKNSKLEINVEENPGRFVRETQISISGENQKTDLTIRQLGYEPVILVDEQYVEMGAVGGKVTLSVTTNIDVKVVLPNWIKEQNVSTRAASLVTKEHVFMIDKLTSNESRQGNIEFTEILPDESKSETAKTCLVAVKQKGLGDYSADGADKIKDDIKIKVVSGNASSYQSGQEIDKSFDGDLSTMYHSNWNNSSDNYFPITLTYNFEKPTDTDYLIYYPRTEGSNGFFKQVEIQYSADGNNFVKLADKDFKGLSTATKFLFDKTIRAKSFRFIVKSGTGDGRGFATCSEMEFYTKNPSLFDYSTLFTDATCSELKNGITEAQIDQCEFPFFKNLAYFILKGSYPKEFRIATFNAYPNPDVQAAINKTSTYSLLDNPTGISVNAGETFIVLVGNTHGKSISLRVQNLDKAGGDGFGGLTYPLSEGLNKFVIKEKGLVYVMYHTDVLVDPSALPIKIHFASGTVNGYYDSQKHAGRWSELLGKATDKYFDVLGQYAHLTFETADFRTYASNNGNRLIEIYDDIVYKQGLLLGLFKYGGMFKNRMYLSVMYHSYMYASSYHTGYHRNTMSGICNPDKVRTTDCWGPAHEIGHVNQTRPGLNWIGTTEVTNNIMSEYIQTTVFNQPSRIQTEDMGPAYRNRYSKAWTGIIANQRPHADFANLGKDANDVFCKLIPFWQLELYFGKVLGRTPLQQADKGGFYPDVYEYARKKNYNGMTNGEIQLDFVYNCCLAAKTNLLDFFEKWGFLTLIDKEIEDYSAAQLTVTQRMVDALKAKVNGLGYHKPDVALEYISDNTVELFKTKPGIARGANATRTARDFVENGVSYKGTEITIPNWQNVAVYEVHNADGKSIFICSGECTPSNTDSFILPIPWENGFKLFAVSVLGSKVEIPVN